ncbi:Glycosyltransferase involved in cell wall bisynthesis [Anaerocolumna jejuensis DSM 15929]|uniref:Glycosyltransferase involved in cell wall bisynthesis n=1 Tax=Anaerocolumna jejuensis DSM 15929 TaxID=1121322 RepID=A0A1M6YNI3_9FIRM|nr:glycosyltransferase family 2 protein [Anaerocolumna jejuensis]SHL19808.1 Glycosyltransferase involved in cell wall bisynthesis [Anaerocolumna jejuensis DSM 15929]
MMKVSASVIIPTYNKSQYLDYTLAGYLNQSVKDYELIIINDGSDDITDEIVKKYINKLPIQYCVKKNGGISESRNKGLSLAQSDIIIFTDDDRIPSPDFIENIITTICNSPKTVVVGQKEEIYTIYSEKIVVSGTNINESIRGQEIIQNWKMVNKGIGLMVSMPFTTTKDITSDFNKTINRLYFRTAKDNYRYVIDRYGNKLLDFNFGWVMATGGNTSFNRKYVPEIQFDTSFVKWGVEDIEFAYRLNINGYKFIHSDEVINYHQRHANGGDRHQTLTNNLAIFATKYPNLDVYLYWQRFQGRKWKADFNYIRCNETYQYLNGLSFEHPLWIYQNHLLKQWEESQKAIINSR